MTELHGKIIGFRSWDIKRESGGLALHSTGAGKMCWKPGPNKAECTAEGDYVKNNWGGGVLVSSTSSGGAESLAWYERLHHPPNEKCGCGLYARYGPVSEPRSVQGVVVAWGRVAVHPDGFRAEYAQPVLFSLPEKAKEYPEAVEMLREVAYHYECRVVDEADLVRVAQEFGKPVPKSERPKLPKEAASELPWQITQPGPGQVYFVPRPRKKKRGGFLRWVTS